MRLENKEKLEQDFNMETALICRICGAATFCVFDLGFQPFANALIDEPKNDTKKYPLKLHVCSGCALGQLSYCADSEELYKNYLYVSPKSSMLQEHFGRIMDFLEENNYINSSSRVLEIGSNIGSFLEYIKPHVASILGVDPAVNIAQMANQEGIATVNDFFNSTSAENILRTQGKKEVIVARHCFAHNEKPGLMLEGVQKLLSDNGVFLVENAYFLDTVLHLEVDQIYHEHMYYYNLRGMSMLLDQYGFSLVDAYHSPIHGGSMLYVSKRKSSNHPVHDRVREGLEQEKNMHCPDFYKDFVKRIERNKKEFRVLIDKLISEGRTIHVYGASAKSTVLLNYYGINSQIVPYAVDSTEIKHGKYIPGANIQVISEEDARRNLPDYYLLTSWNYKDEIIHKVRSWGNTKTKFILPHPGVKILE